MAKSRFEYVKEFESDDRLLPGCWIIVRLDGKGFTKFSAAHDFEKPNDVRALSLMDHCAKAVMTEFSDIVLAYGESDEYSFMFRRLTTLYGRRASKLVSLIASCFTGNYVRHWGEHLADTPLHATPMFDGRAVLYPSQRALRDYLSWRQADTHVNNQYNTCYWALVKSGMSGREAQDTLKGTLTQDKNELLFSRFGINYSHLPPQLRKGSVIIRLEKPVVKTLPDGTEVQRSRNECTVLHEDIIGDAFWRQHPELLAD